MVRCLIDTMVMRGYLERTPDTEDRRRMLLHLTPRVGLSALCEISAESESAHAGQSH